MIENPLTVFPSKSGRVVRVLHSSTQIKTATFDDRTSAPDFGSTRSEEVKRTFRRNEASALFAHPAPSEVPLSLLYEGMHPSTYVLLDEARLVEVLRLEDLLRKERETLGQQCAQVLPTLDSSFPEEPTKANRYAVSSACMLEMKQAARQTSELRAAWAVYSAQNHYDKPHLYRDNAFLEHCPVSERILKTKLLARSVQAFRVRYNRDSMVFEDELSHVTDRFERARDRKRDYEAYYILANRYGAFDGGRFSRTDSPGREYLQAVQRAARVYQRLWSRYWRSTSRRRYRRATTIQTAWRRYFAVKKYYPLVALRLRMKDRLKLIAGLHKWKAYLRLCAEMRELLTWWLDFRRIEALALAAWRASLIESKRRREQKLAPHLAMRNRLKAQQLFGAWKGRLGRTKILMAQYPHFYVWRANVRDERSMRRRHSAAGLIVGFMRLNRTKILILRNRKVQLRVRQFTDIITAKNLMRFRRQMLLTVGFERWVNARADQSDRYSVDLERNRLQRLMEHSRRIERDMASQLAAHLASGDGEVQLEEAVRGAGAVDAGHSHVEGDLRRRCTAAAHALAHHDFETRSPPFIRCPDPQCAAICTTVPQYLEHAKRAAHPDYSTLSLTLRDQSGRRELLNLVVQRLGLGALANTLELTAALQDLRRHPSSDFGYLAAVERIASSFLDKSAVRPTLLSGPSVDRLLLQIESIKSERSDSDCSDMFFATREVAGKTLFRKIFRLPSRKYRCWTDAKILWPAVVYEVEWEAFRSCFDALGEEFTGSEAVQAVHVQRAADDARRKQVLLEEFRDLRLRGIRDWSAAFRRQEVAIAAVAERVLLEIEQELVARQLEVAVATVGEERATWEAELVGASLDEVERAVLDELFEYLAPVLVDTMLTIPAYRVQALRFGGDGNAFTREVLSAPSETQAETRLALLVRSPVQRDIDAKATRLQAQVRRLLAQKAARRAFIAAYTKRFNPSEGRCYYVNNFTGEVAWTPPAITRRLFPQLSW